jgi:linoleoyl-CoA desaturase
MHGIAGCILSIVFQMAHVVEGTEQLLPDSEGIIHEDWAVHDLFPNISHVHYRKIAPIVERTAKEFGCTYNLKPTFRNAIYSHLKRLKELGRPS